jgi:hypothetical protein
MTKVLGIALQLGLLVLVIHEFSLESKALFHISILTLIGFLIHAFLPSRFRLSFFVLISLAGIAWVFGFSNGAWLIVIGTFMIGICHFPVPFFVRGLILLITGAALAAFRLDWLEAPWSTAIWPTLGSMFMFRLIVYLYDLRHEKNRQPLSGTLSYFFLLPNVCFPLFPVIDYKTFRRTYYDTDAHLIYQSGIQWMLRGITHLILYRLIYYHLTIPPSEVTSAGGILRFLVTNYLLYLRVSGQFHLIVGMLHLFGFNLPETNHRYLLASSFTDFWRRINIYWKDFMMKIFYYPAFLKARKWGTQRAYVIATLLAFLATWFLHSYQWFWFRGDFLFSWQDTFFWGILAVLVVANTLYESKHGRERTLGMRARTFRDSIFLCLRTTGTFATICVLWSLWTSDSLSEWFSLWSFRHVAAIGDLGWLPPLLVGAVMLKRPTAPIQAERVLPGWVQRIPSFYRSTAVTGISILLLYLVGNPTIYSRLGPQISEVIHSLRQEKLNRQNAALVERGYYENLLGVDRLNTRLLGVYAKQPKDWISLQETEAMRPTHDFLKEELVPLTQIRFKNQILHTNRWGMRDKDYEQLKPPNSYRIALLGSSHVMGSGVADDETFECLLENRLNSDTGNGKNLQYEILNFAVDGRTPLQQVIALENKVFSFQPDAVFYVAHGSDEEQALRHIIRMVRSKINIPYPDLNLIVKEAGVDAAMSEVLVERGLKPFGPQILSWAYQRIAQDCRKVKITPVWIFLPSLRTYTTERQVANLVGWANQAGFTVLDLTGVYDGHEDDNDMLVAEWDNHPSAKGHKLIAMSLYRALKENRHLIPLVNTAADKHISQSGNQTQ